MSNFKQLTIWLKKKYDVIANSLFILENNCEIQVYRVNCDNNIKLILKVYPLHADFEALQGQAYTISYLEQVGYPAPRIISALDGSVIAKSRYWYTFLVTFIDGVSIDYKTQYLNHLGTMLGRLHALNSEYVLPTNYPIPISKTEPEIQVPETLKLLSEVSNRIPNELSKLYNRLVSSLCSLDILQNLPQTIVHTDPWPGNAVLSSDNQMVFVDWENSGLGYAVIDLGLLLNTCDGGTKHTSWQRPNPNLIVAIINGYTLHRTLTDTEIAALPAAIRFRPTVYTARLLAETIMNGTDNKKLSLWKSRFEASEEIAVIANECFT